MLRIRAVAGLAAALFSVAALAQGMPRTPADAQRMEAADALPRGAFYDTPADLARTRPGDLLRAEPGRGYQLPPGASAVRILYHSRDASGRDVATSGVVLVPGGSPPRGGWPLIAWAHGTSGVARACAPSLMKDVYYGDEGVFPMLKAGFAVVATDYHGLGTDGVHEYVSKRAQANDVVFSIPAARAAVRELSGRWAVVGHSQGGLAAWGVGELEAARRDPGYLGAIAVAPATQLKWVLTTLGPGKAAGFYVDYLSWAIRARTPSFRPSDMLTGPALGRYGDVTSNGCFYYAYASFLADPAAPVLKSGWAETPGARRFFAEDEVARAPIAAPFLVIAGEADATVPIASVRRSAAEACARAQPVELVTYPGLDHDPVMANSTPDQLAWIRDRLAGRPPPKVCSGPP